MAKTRVRAGRGRKAAAAPPQAAFVELDITDTPEFFNPAGIEPRLYEGAESIVLRFPTKPRDNPAPAAERVTASRLSGEHSLAS
jgi:hypothetical protein